MPAPALAAAAAKHEKHGTLASRSSEIPRDATRICNLAINWETRAIVPYQTINKMNHPLKLMITNEMRPIMAELEKKMHLKTVKGQFKGYFESSMEPVRCWEEHSKHIETRTVLGDMKGGELKTAINDSTIGKLNKYLAVLRTYIEEELDPKHRSALPAAGSLHMPSCLLILRTLLCAAQRRRDYP